MLEIQGVEKKACCGNGGSQTRGPVQSKQDFPKMLCTYEEALRWLNSPKMVKVFKFWEKQFSVSLDIVQSISLCFFRIYGQFWWIFKAFESHRIGCHGNGIVYASFSVKKRPVFHWNCRKCSCERLKAF